MDKDHLSRLLDFIDSKNEDSIDFLKKLVGFDSTFIDQGICGNELAIQEYLENYLIDLGFKTRLFEPDNEKMKEYADFNPGHNYANRPNLAAILPGKGNGKSIILNGHADTVPLGELSQWQHDPLKGEIADGKLYGRGTCDMKAGMAAMILAVRYLKETGLQPSGDVKVLSVVDEEGGGNGTLACMAEGYWADAAIVTEPTQLQILAASRGVFLLQIDVPGKATHAALKWGGVNAIEKAIKIYDGLKELEHLWLAKRHNPLLPSPTITIGHINGGLAGAIVAGECSMKLDLKYLPVEIDENGKEKTIDGESVRREVTAWIERICQGDEWLSQHPPRLNWYLHVLPHWLGADHPIVHTLQDASHMIMGKSRVSGLPSGADARILQNVGKIPTVLFGPGNLQYAHSIDEYVEIDQFFSAIKILAAAIWEWTSQ